MESKQYQLNNFVSGNEELQKQLHSTTNFISDIIEKHKTVHSQFTKNYNSLWCNYQNKINELEESKQSYKCLSDKLCELNINFETLKCQLKEQDDKNKQYTELYNQLEANLNEEKNNVTCLNSENQNQKICLNITSDDLNKTTQILTEKINELDCTKLENDKLKSKCEFLEDELKQIVNKYEQVELQLQKNENISKTELQVLNFHNTELKQIVNDQNKQLKRKTEILEELNEKIKELKQTLEKETIQGSNCLDEIRKEKLSITNDNERLKKNIKEHMEKSKCLKLQNEQYETQINELQYELSTAVKTSNEMQKIAIENEEKVCGDIKKLTTEITSKNQCIVELEEKLSEINKMYLKETENVNNLKRKLDNLRYKPIKLNQYLNIDCDYQITDCVSQVIDELQLDSPNMSINEDTSSCLEVSEIKNESFDELIVKCNSIVNRYKQINSNQLYQVFLTLISHNFFKFVIFF